MRTLFKASLAILLTDMYTKEPITNAVVLCDGQQKRYNKAAGGYYAFSDLYPKKYRIDIICKGFLDICFDIETKANVTKTIMLNLPYAVDNQALQREKRFEIHVNKDGMPWKNSDVRLKLVDDLNFLKLVKPAKAKKNKVVFNIENNKSYVFQKYSYLNAGTENEFYIYGYDLAKSKYLLEEPLEAGLTPGGQLYPIWDLKTDDKGKIVLPIFRQFMKGNKAQFEVFADGKYAKMKLSVPEVDDNEKLIIAETDLTELAPPKLPKTLHPQEEDAFDDMEEGAINIDFSAMNNFAPNGQMPMQGQMMPPNGQMPMQGQMMPPNGPMPMQGQMMPPNGPMPMQGQMMPPNGPMPMQGQMMSPNGQMPMQGQMMPPNGQMPQQGNMGAPNNLPPNAPMPQQGNMGAPNNLPPNAPMPPQGNMGAPNNLPPNAPMPPQGNMGAPNNLPPNGQMPPQGNMGAPNNLPPNAPMPPQGNMGAPHNLPPNGQMPPQGNMGAPNNLPPNGQMPPQGNMGAPNNLPPNGQMPPQGNMGAPNNLPPNGQMPPKGNMGTPNNLPPNSPQNNLSTETAEAEAIEDGIHEFKKGK